MSDIVRLSEGGGGIPNAASMAEGAIKDTTGMDIITKTLKEVQEASQTQVVRNDLLASEGIGKNLNGKV